LRNVACAILEWSVVLLKSGLMDKKFAWLGRRDFKTVLLLHPIEVVAFPRMHTVLGFRRFVSIMILLLYIYTPIAEVGNVQVDG